RYPTGEDCSQERSAEWHEDQQKTKMQAGHHRTEKKEREFREPPGKTERDLDKNESEQQDQEYFSSRQIERHGLPFQDASHVHGQRESEFERRNSDSCAVRRDWQGHQAEQECERKPDTLFGGPSPRLEIAAAKVYEPAHPINEK